ncbi:MAG TPA: hypothetical protein VKG79_05140, partial [Bryobacteraceae bacterium]|nr:hypothetical protein [Bryobacteraceae bacterium]
FRPRAQHCILPGPVWSLKGPLNRINDLLDAPRIADLRRYRDVGYRVPAAQPRMGAATRKQSL